MPFLKRIEDELARGHAAAKLVALELAQADPNILFISLAGAWTWGIVSPCDVDLVIVFACYDDLKMFCKRPLPLKNPYQYHFDLHCYSFEQFRGRMLSCQPHMAVVKAVYQCMHQLRRTPALQRVFNALLGHHKSVLQLYEAAPQAHQAMLPLVDQHQILARLQQEQKPLLDDDFSLCEKLLYRPGGFYLLLEKYLVDEVRREDVKKALINFCADSRAYLQRAMAYYAPGDAIKIGNLYRDLYGVR
jgi:hypothetical protein